MIFRLYEANRDAAIETSMKFKNVKFGIVRDGALVAPSFSLSLNKKGDLYLTQRELSNEKLSMHKSGINRFATVSLEPRAPILAAQMPSLESGKFITVYRIIYTFDSLALPTLGPIPEGLLGVEPPNSDVAIEFTIGYTKRDPRFYNETRSNKHIFISEINADKFVTITLNSHTLSELACLVEGHLKPRKLTPASSQFQSGEPSGFHMLQYSSHLWTFINWAHCGIDNSKMDAWKLDNPVFIALSRADSRFATLKDSSELSGTNFTFQNNSRPF